MGLLKGYKEGSDLTILNATYHRPHRDDDNNYVKDNMVVVFKDNITGEKKHQIIEQPKYRFYMANDDVTINHNMFYIPEEKVHPVECAYTDLTKTIADLTGNLDFFYENIRARNFGANKALHTHNRVFMSDQHIEDHYRARFAQEYTNENVPISKGYFDIEVDTKPIGYDFPQMGQCPINAVSLIIDSTKMISSFILRDDSNPLIQEFEDLFKNASTRNALFEELHQFIIDNVGGPEKAEKFGIADYGVQFLFFDTEEELLRALFATINRDNPDFMLAWNMAFDVPYIIERCYQLGLDPAEILSAPDFGMKYAEYYIDEKHRNDYELRGDFYDIASEVTYMDQLIQFASRRKGQAAFPNFKLDTAADIITKGAVRKLDYSHITNTLGELPYLDFKTFIFYNIMDTIAQKCIEVTVADVDYIYGVCLANDTRYSKGHRQTVYLGNRTRKFFYQNGFICGNNCSTGDSVKYPGAIVGDPTHNSDYGKKRLGDQILNIVDNSDDFDFKSLYPSETREHNMAPDTIIGKILIDDKVHKKENPYHNEQYDRGGQFIEDLTSGNPIEFCSRWFNFANFKELLEDMNEYYSLHKPIFEPEVYDNNGMMKPFVTRPKLQGQITRPFGYWDKDQKPKPFYIHPDADELIRSVL